MFSARNVTSWRHVLRAPRRCVTSRRHVLLVASLSQVLCVSRRSVTFLCASRCVAASRRLRMASRFVAFSLSHVAWSRSLRVASPRRVLHHSDLSVESVRPRTRLGWDPTLRSLRPTTLTSYYCAATTIHRYTLKTRGVRRLRFTLFCCVRFQC